MRDTNNFAPNTKDCTALGLRSSKFEFILLRSSVRICLCERDGSGASWKHFHAARIDCRMVHTTSVFYAWRNTTDRDVSVSSNPAARAHEAAGDSSSKRSKENFGEIFDTTKHSCSSPGYCVRDAHVVCQSADAIKLNFRNLLGAFELMCSAGDWIKNGLVGRRRRNAPRQAHAGVRWPYSIVSWR
jgi:hypothetical protein